MKVLVVRADAGGSGFYRVNEPVRAVQELGLGNLEVEVTGEVEAMAGQNPDGSVEVARIMTDADVIVLQRPLRQQIHEVAKAAKRQEIALVVELDDDFETVSRHNAAWRHVNPRTSPLHNVDWLRKTLSLADAITVSTGPLMKYADLTAGKLGYVVRNRMPERVLDAVAALPQPEHRLLGWTGTVFTHPFDLQQIQRATRALVPEVSPRLVVVGQEEGVAATAGVRPEEVEATDWVPTVEGYLETVRTHIGVGVVPLEPGPFNEGKSFLKGLEYAVCGIPFVASNTAEYRLLEVCGAGRIARRPNEWTKLLRGLLTDEDRYGRMAEDGLLAVRKDWILEDHAHEWVDAWMGAWKNAR